MACCCHIFPLHSASINQCYMRDISIFNYKSSKLDSSCSAAIWLHGTEPSLMYIFICVLFVYLYIICYYCGKNTRLWAIHIFHIDACKKLYFLLSVFQPLHVLSWKKDHFKLPTCISRNQPRWTQWSNSVFHILQPSVLSSAL